MSPFAPHESTYMLTAMEDALKKRIKEELSSPLKKMATELIDKAVDDAVATLNLESQMFRDYDRRCETVQFIVRKSVYGQEKA